jgi:hypothetical protein
MSLAAVPHVCFRPWRLVRQPLGNQDPCADPARRSGLLWQRSGRKPGVRAEPAPVGPNRWRLGPEFGELRVSRHAERETSSRVSAGTLAPLSEILGVLAKSTRSRRLVGAPARDRIADGASASGMRWRTAALRPDAGAAAVASEVFCMAWRSRSAPIAVQLTIRSAGRISTRSPLPGRRSRRLVLRFGVPLADAPVAFGDAVVVDAGIAASHQSVFVELPMLVAVASPPLASTVL